MVTGVVGVEFLSLVLPIFYKSFLLISGFFPETEGTSAPPPCGLLVGIYLFYENWSTETFRKRESEKWDVCSTYLSWLMRGING